MSLNLLHTYVTTLIERTFSKKFRYNVFKKLEGEDQFEYVDSNLRSLGKGSSRWVYLLNSKRVLKLAVNEAGIEQNKNELAVFQNPISKHFVTRVFAYAPDMSWLISELVRPLHNSKEFETLTGVSIDTVNSLLYAVKSNFKDWIASELQKDKNEFLHKLVAFIKATGLEGDDIGLPRQWGKTPDNRIVLLDYGLTPETWIKHYSQGAM